ncbi:MAG: hypothetical protein RL266_2198, partial [Bacteroidota bacterium]
MTRPLPLIAACTLISIASLAQSYSDRNLRAYDSSLNHTTEEVQRPDETTLSTRAEGDTIWYDSFADLSNWTLGTTGAFGTADSLWEYTTTGPYGTFSGTWGDIQSATDSD